MLVNKNTYGYKLKKKHITGRGFVDSLSSVFNSLRTAVVPALKTVGSYVSNNRDLIAKPVLGAIGSLAATGLTAGVPALISHIVNRNSSLASSNTSGSASSNTSGSASSNRLSNLKVLNDPKYKEILQTMMTPATPVTNIIGSGSPRVKLVNLE